MSALHIREITTDKIEDTFDTSDMPVGQIDRLERGILINLDRDNFYVELED